MLSIDWVRPPAVAGFFYTDDPSRLSTEVDGFVAAARRHAPEDETVPKALVVPHAGYRYSGPVAGSGYARLLPARDIIRRVVLIGPAHRVAVDGIGVSGAEAFATPLGTVTVDHELREQVLGHPGVHIDDVAHAQEHSLEVHLPFLQRLLSSFTVLPLVCGQTDVALVSQVLAAVWGGPETLIVVSTDLSHYRTHDAAVEIDRRTAAAVIAREVESIGPHDACGFVPLRGMLDVARRRDLHVELLDLRTSGETDGPKDRVVGYGAFAVV